MPSSRSTSNPHLREPSVDTPIDPSVGSVPREDIHSPGTTSKYWEKKKLRKKLGIRGSSAWVSGPDELPVVQNLPSKIERIFSIFRKKGDAITLVVYAKGENSPEDMPDFELPVVFDNDAEHFSQAVENINQRLNIMMFQPLVLETKDGLTGCFAFGYNGRVENSRPIGSGQKLRCPTETTIAGGIRARLCKEDQLALGWALKELYKNPDYRELLKPVKTEFKLVVPRGPRKKKEEVSPDSSEAMAA